jgi:hypothetical protein
MRNMLTSSSDNAAIAQRPQALLRIPQQGRHRQAKTMQKINFGQSVQILANVGVVAGIIFLALEVQQNNDSLAAQASLGRLAATTSRLALGLNNPDLAHINFKAMSGEALTPEERNRYFDYTLYTMMHWRWEYEAYRAGDLSYLDLPAWRVQASFSPIWREAWEGTLGTRDDEFARFVNENVFSE